MIPSLTVDKNNKVQNKNNGTPLISTITSSRLPRVSHLSACSGTITRNVMESVKRLHSLKMSLFCGGGRGERCYSDELFGRSWKQMVMLLLYIHGDNISLQSRCCDTLYVII